MKRFKPVLLLLLVILTGRNLASSSHPSVLYHSYTHRASVVRLHQNSLIISAVDLNDMHEVPSQEKIIYSSVATARERAGIRKKLQLSAVGWTHPSVLCFNEKWHGYKYWTAITPFPQLDNQYENPHIFCSDDGVHWKEPVGLHNPIEPCPRHGYNSDPNLMYSDNILYCYWRSNGIDSGRALYVKKSKDGVHWFGKRLVCEWPLKDIDVIAPSVVADGNLYYCYGICTGETHPGSYFNTISIRRMISDNPEHGFKPVRGKDYTLINIPGRPWGPYQEPWHLEVQRVANLWLMLVTTTNLGKYGTGGRLFLGYSFDGVNFNFANKPIGIFTGSTYKSSFHPSLNIKRREIDIELWRAMTSDGWTIFHDTFSVKVALSVIA